MLLLLNLMLNHVSASPLEFNHNPDKKIFIFGQKNGDGEMKTPTIQKKANYFVLSMF